MFGLEEVKYQDVQRLFIPAVFERIAMFLLLSDTSQLCSNRLKPIYTVSTPSRHSGSSLKDINTAGNETQSDGFEDLDVRWLTEMPSHLI